MTAQKIEPTQRPVKDNRVFHGLSKTREYITWKAMKARCYRPKAENFKHYGGKDVPITVCDEWKNSFLTFLSDMGPKPTPKHEIHRIDSDKEYCKLNCKWATRTEQNQNSNHNVLNADQVREVRRLYADGISRADIASMFDVGWGNVDGIVKDKHWKGI